MKRINKKSIVAMMLTFAMLLSLAPITVSAVALSIDFETGVTAGGQLQVQTIVSGNEGGLDQLGSSFRRDVPNVLTLVSINGVINEPGGDIPGLGLGMLRPPAGQFAPTVLFTNMNFDTMTPSNQNGVLATLLFDVAEHTGNVVLSLDRIGLTTGLAPQAMINGIAGIDLPIPDTQTLTFEDGRIAGSFEFYAAEIAEGVVPVEFEQGIAAFDTFRVVTEGLADGNFAVSASPALPSGVTIDNNQVAIENNRGLLRLNFDAAAPDASVGVTEHTFTLTAGDVLEATTDIPVELTINERGLDAVNSLTFAPNQAANPTVAEDGFTQISVTYGPEGAVDPSRGVVFETAFTGTAGDLLTSVQGATISLMPAMGTYGETITVRARIVNIADDTVLFPDTGWSELTVEITEREVGVGPGPTPTVSPPPTASPTPTPAGPRPPRPGGVGGGGGGGGGLGGWQPRPLVRPTPVPVVPPMVTPDPFDPPFIPQPTPETFVPAPFVPAPPSRTVNLTIGDINYTVDGMGQITEPGLAPFIDSATGRTMVPLRAISEDLGADVVWLAETRTAIVSLADRTIRLQVDTPLPGGYGTPMIRNDRTFVPVRWIAEQLGGTVIWNEATQGITIAF